MTPTGAGFGYRALTRLLNEKETVRPLLAQLHAGDDREELAIAAIALVRGNGKTEGLHRRAVRTSRMEQIEGGFGPRALDRVGEVAAIRSDEAGEAARRLRRALILLMQGGPDKARLDDDAANRKADPWLRRFDAAVDREFFGEALWSEAADDDKPHHHLWRSRLRTLAGAVFADAAEAAPRTEMRRIRAIARARTMLDAQMMHWIREVPDGE